MSDRPLAFTVANFSEQFLEAHQRPHNFPHHTYSAVLHCDGEVYQWRKALMPEFVPPLAMLRSEAWLALLKMISERVK